MMNDRPLSDKENEALDADLALLAQSDPAPDVSAALLTRVLGDAADMVRRPAPVTAAAPARPSPRKFGFGASFGRFWQPLSAGFAAAALGVWLGWADPIGVSAYANPFETTYDTEADQLDEIASLLDMEL